MYNTTEMVLKWEEDNPLMLDPDLQLTEYSLTNFWTNESEGGYSFEQDMVEVGMDRFGRNNGYHRNFRQAVQQKGDGSLFQLLFQMVTTHAWKWIFS